MSNAICSVADCESSVLARGWCRLHYDSWRRLGDPLAAKRYMRQGDSCSVEGCSAAARVKGYCRLHYKRVLVHGTPLPRFRGEVVDGRRICPRCKVDRPLSEWGAAAYCKPCICDHVRGYYEHVRVEPATCAQCGQGFLADKRRYIFCSAACSEAGKNRRNSKHVLARRARQRAATVENFRPEDIYERDNWVCQLCGDPIDRLGVAPEPLSRSIDHIVPIARGGEHSRANTQAAHLGCNVRKGVRMMSQVP